jgi:hypothetical protein
MYADLNTSLYFARVTHVLHCTYSFSLALDFEAAISSQLGSKGSSDWDGGFAKV